MASSRRARIARPAFTSPPEVVPPSPPPSGPETPVQYARGVGPTRARLLERLGIRTAGDLLSHLPRRLEDRSHLRAIYDLHHGTVETVQGVIGQVRQFRPPRRRGH